MAEQTGGIFITLEGGDGSGKSTQIALLAEWLNERGLDVLTTREPGGTLAAEAVRDVLMAHDWDPLSEVFLLSAARRDHLRRVIRPALEAGQWVICDRFSDSTIAYQGYGRGLEPVQLRGLDRLVCGEMRPDLTLILDVPPRLGLRRALIRDGQAMRFEQMGRSFQELVHDGFQAIARSEPDRCVLIPADAPPETVFAMIRQTVTDRLLGGMAG